MNHRDLYELELRLFYYIPFSGLGHRNILLDGIYLEIETNVFADDYEDMVAASHADHCFDVNIRYDRGRLKAGLVSLVTRTTMRELGVVTLNPYAILTSPAVQTAMSQQLPESITSRLSIYNQCYRDYTIEEYLYHVQHVGFPQGLVYHTRYTVGDFFATVEYRLDIMDGNAQVVSWAVLYNNLHQRRANVCLEQVAQSVSDSDELENKCWKALVERLTQVDDMHIVNQLDAQIRMRNIDRMLELV